VQHLNEINKTLDILKKECIYARQFN